MSCITKLLSASKELHDYIRDKAGIDYDPATGKGKQEWIKAAKDLQEHSVKSLNDIYANLKIAGFKKSAQIETGITDEEKNRLIETIPNKIAKGGVQDLSVSDFNDFVKNEVAQQANASESEQKTAREFYGNELVDYAKKLYPESKTEINPQGELATKENQSTVVSDKKSAKELYLDKKKELVGKYGEGVRGDPNLEYTDADTPEKNKDRKEFRKLETNYDEEKDIEQANSVTFEDVPTKQIKEWIADIALNYDGDKASLIRAKKMAAELFSRNNSFSIKRDILDYWESNGASKETLKEVGKNVLKLDNDSKQIELKPITNKEVPIVSDKKAAPISDKVKNKLQNFKKQLNEQDTSSKEQVTEGNAKQSGDKVGKSNNGGFFGKIFKKRAKPTIKSPLYLKALSQESQDPLSQVLKYFIGGGGISDSALKELFSNNRGEINAKISLRRKNAAKTIRGLAHEIWQNSPQEIQDKYDDTKFREAIETVLQEHNARTTMAEQLAGTLAPGEKEMSDWYNNTYGGYEDIIPEENLSHAIDMLEGLSDAEIQKIADTEQDALNDSDYVNNLFHVKEPSSKEVEQMKDIVKDIIDEGTTELKSIQKIIADELGDNSEKMKQLVEDAYNEAGKELKIADTDEQGAPIKNELTTSFAKRVNTFIDKIFGKSKEGERTVVLKDTKALMDKAKELGANKFQDVSIKEMIRYKDAVEPYEDENGELKKVPELKKDGKIDKDLMAGLLMYHAPQKFLFSSPESVNEAIDFLKKLNTQLNDSTLSDTISFLESQIPYLEKSKEINSEAFKKLEENQKNQTEKNIWLKIEKTVDVNTKAQGAISLRMELGSVMTNYINRTYDGLWDKYVTNDGKNTEEIIPQKLLPKGGNSLTNEQQEVKTQLDEARNEYQTAKKAFDKKRSEVDKRISGDQEDLFGERKTENKPQLFDERISTSARDKAVQPFKDRLTKAEDAVNKLQKKFDDMGGTTAQISMFQDAKGEVLGFTHNGKIYLNGEKLNPNTPVHEAGHIWTEWAKQNDEKLYNAGIDKIKDSRYLKKAQANEFYKAEAEKLPEDQREAYFQHEALAAAIGDKGAQFITEAKRNSFVEWAKALWEKVGKALGFKDVTPDELQNMTLDEFSKRAAADILKGEPQKSAKGEGDFAPNQRKFTKQVLEDEAILPKGEIAKKLDYIRQSNAMSIGDASKIIDQVGVDEAFDMVVHDKDVKPAVRVVMGQMLIKKFNTLAADAKDEETRNYYIDKTIQAADYVTEKLATEPGQMIQAFSLYSRLSPEAQMRSAIKDVKEQAQKRMQKRQGDVNTIGDKLKKINAETADEVINSPKIKKSVETKKAEQSKARVENLKKKVDSAAERLKDALIPKHLRNVGKQGVGLEQVIDKAAFFIKDAIDKGADIKEAIDKAVKHLKDNWDSTFGKFDDNAVRGHFQEVGDLAQKASDLKLAGGLKDLEKEIGKIVKEHFTVSESAKESLVNKFINDAGLGKSEAEDLAKTIQAEFDNIATRKKQNILDSELRRFNRVQKALKGAKKVERKTLQDDVIKYSNLGAFDNDSLSKMMAAKLGTGTLTPEQGKEIQRLAEKIQKAPEGSPRSDAVQDLLTYRANLEGNSLFGVAQAVWYANILSGYLTHIRNIVSTFYNGFAFFATEATRDPKSVPALLYGGARGVKRGGIEAWHTLTTGRSPIHVSKIEIPQVLERIKFVGGLLNPANYLKYVGRMMVAEDVLQFQGLKEMRATQFAYRVAKRLGYSNPFSKQVWRVVNEQLLNTPERIEAAKDQVRDEGLKGTEAARRIYEIIEQSRPIQMQEDSYGFAAKGTFNHDTEGTLGALSDSVSKFLDNSLQAGGTKPLRFLIPFTRIITNVANNTLDFSPVGAVRGILGRRGIFASEGSGKRKVMSKEERQQTIVKAALGISSMAALYYMSQNGGPIQISGAGPSNIQKRLQLIQEGWQPFSIKIGDKYYSYKLTPMVFAWGIVGSVRDHEEYDKDGDQITLGHRVALATWDGAKSIGDMTWVSSAAPIMSAFSSSNPGEAGSLLGNAGKQTAKGFVLPNAYTQSAEKIEQVFHVPQKQANNLGQSLISNIPIARNSLNDRINALGDPVVKDVDILESDETKDPTWKYLLDKKGWVAPVNKNTVMYYDAKIKADKPVDEDEYYEFSKLRGHKIKEEINDIIKNGASIWDDNTNTYNQKTADQLTSKELNKLLTPIKTQATKDAKFELFSKYSQ